MPLAYSTHVQYSDKDNQAFVIAVRSSKCLYSVAIEGTIITICGPGVEHVSELLEELTPEGKALIAVIRFEEDQS